MIKEGTPAGGSCGCDEREKRVSKEQDEPTDNSMGLETFMAIVVRLGLRRGLLLLFLLLLEARRYCIGLVIDCDALSRRHLVPRCHGLQEHTLCCCETAMLAISTSTNAQIPGPATLDPTCWLLPFPLPSPHSPVASKRSSDLHE